jgi:MtN3 and saliva related transmembrane protein
MTWITILGMTAAVLTTGSFLPQAIKTIRSKRTKDLSFGMYATFSTGAFLWIIYGFFIKDLPIFLANGVTLSFTVIILYFIVKHR